MGTFANVILQVLYKLYIAKCLLFWKKNNNQISCFYVPISTIKRKKKIVKYAYDHTLEVKTYTIQRHRPERDGSVSITAQQNCVARLRKFSLQ